MKAYPNFRILDTMQRVRLMDYEHVTYQCVWSGEWASKKDYAAIRDDIKTLREYKSAHPRKYRATLQFNK
jgi:hypothetical protein